METTKTTRAVYIRRLTDLLKLCEPGEKITYDQMTETAGVDVLERPHAALKYAALDLANKECGANFLNVPNVGYERLSDNEAYAVGPQIRRRVRATANRGIRRMRNALTLSNQMDNDAIKKTYAELTHAGLISRLSWDRYTPEVVGDTYEIADPREAALAAVNAMRAAMKGK